MKIRWFQAIWILGLGVGGSLFAQTPKNDVSGLRDAVIAGDLKQVQVLVGKGADVKATRENGGTLLMDAAYYGYIDIVKFLLDQGVDINAQAKNGWTAIMSAARNGNLEILKMLVEKGGDIHKVKKDDHFSDQWNKNLDCSSALLEAVRGGHVEVVEFLIKQGVVVDEVLPPNQVALLIAARNRDHAMVKALIAGGADANIKGENGETALIIAQKNNDDELMAELIKNKADINQADNNGQNSLFLQAEKGNLEILKQLIGMGMDVNTKGKDGVTSLMLAAEKGHLDVVLELISKGADVHTKDANGKTALARAVSQDQGEVAQVLLKNDPQGASPKSSGIGYDELEEVIHFKRDFEILKLLLENGADPNSTSRFGEPIIIDALNGPKDDILRLLIEKGANVNATYKGDSIMSYAVKNRCLHIATLRNAGASTSVSRAHLSQKALDAYLLLAVQKGDAPRVLELLKQGADANVKDEDHWPVIVLAAEKGQMDVLKALLCDKTVQNRSNSDPILTVWNGESDLNAVGPGDWNALMEAAGNGHMEAVELLLDKGVCVGSENHWGLTALDIARDRNLGEMVKLLEPVFKHRDYRQLFDAVNNVNFREMLEPLLQQGIDLDAVNREGNTPLSLALYSHWVGQAKYLISKGANINRKDRSNKTPLLYSLDAYEKDPELVRLLLEKGADPNVQDLYGNTPLKNALKISDPGKRDKIIELLKKAGAKE